MPVHRLYTFQLIEIFDARVVQMDRITEELWDKTQWYGNAFRSLTNANADRQFVLLRDGFTATKYSKMLLEVDVVNEGLLLFGAYESGIKSGSDHSQSSAMRWKNPMNEPWICRSPRKRPLNWKWIVHAFAICLPITP